MIALAATVTFLVLASPAFPQEHAHLATQGQRLGQLSFPTSCAPAVQEDFERAVAMLHSFWYQAAERAFTTVASEDPSCAMAYWGVAMSRFHQHWEHPSPGDVQVALKALEQAKAVESISERERGYIAAIERYYRNANEVDHLQRALAYEEAMRELRERYPDDPEAATFYALALLGTASSSPPDPVFARQKEAAGILEELLPSHPDHPGVAHYLIHASDYPPLAERGLEAARRYAAIAPDAPHALHMPSHIFTQLGLWHESIVSNRAASAAAREVGWIGEELHTTDYLVFAYLQGAQDREAGKIVETLPERTEELRADDTNYPAGLYATAAIPARYAIERRQWEEAAALEVPRDVLRGGSACWAEAPLHLARGLGAVHTGDLEGGRRSVKALEDCRELLLGTGEPSDTEIEDSGVNVHLWANRLETQRRAVVASMALAEGREDEALDMLRSAADLEDAGDKPPITPGAVVPARELLGEMLLELERPAEALTEFERTLEESPTRFRSLYGAARATELASDLERAQEYYARLLEVTGSADTERPELRKARGFVAASSSNIRSPD